MKVVVLFILFALSYTFSKGQNRVKNDSSRVAVRTIDQGALEGFRHDKDFNYNRLKEPAESIWEKFWNWVWWQVEQVMSSKKGRVTVWTVVVMIGLAILIFLAFRVTGFNRQSLFARNDKSSLPYDISTEDIHQISFDKAIEKARVSGNFRLALRLLYLQALKKLSDKGYIDWQINKTNSDYISELVNKPLHSVFKGLTLQFESTWYGEKNIDKDDFEGLQLQFQQFNNQL